MIDRLRTKLAMLLFKWGRQVHPDVSRLHKQVDLALEDLVIYGSGMLKVEYLDSKGEPK